MIRTDDDGRLRARLAWTAAVLTAALAAGCGGGAGSGPGAIGGGDAATPRAAYRLYVGAESADRIHRLRFDGAELHVEQTREIGRMPTEVEGPHGLAVSPDGRVLYMSTGHGMPEGHLWKFDVGPDTLLAEPVPLGDFPATLDLTPDGLYAFVVNFNLYGGMDPSTLSVVYTPDMVEVERIDLCTMPHGARIHPSGNWLYTVCMMDDVLVEVDTRSFRVTRMFALNRGAEGEVAPDPRPQVGAGAERCTPTWAQPSPDGSRIHVACNASDEIVEISLDDWELTRRFETGRGPYNLATTTDGRLLVATLKQGNAVEFFELETGRSRAVTPTSTRVVHGVVVSPDDRYAFVSVEGVGAEPGRVDAYELEGFRRVADVEVGQQASGIDFLDMAPAPPARRGPG